MKFEFNFEIFFVNFEFIFEFFLLISSLFSSFFVNFEFFVNGHEVTNT